MFDLPEDVRMHHSEQFASFLTTSSNIKHLDLLGFSQWNDKGEGALVLSALTSSYSLTKITHFSCGYNSSWFSWKKKGNAELLCEAIRAMTSLKYLNLYASKFSTKNMYVKVCSAILANQE